MFAHILGGYFCLYLLQNNNHTGLSWKALYLSPTGFLLDSSWGYSDMYIHTGAEDGYLQCVQVLNNEPTV